MTDLRFPIGKFSLKSIEVSEADRDGLIRDIAETPAKLRTSVEGLSAEQLNTPYRLEGWTVRQVVHHVPDSHCNAYTRFKLALTEDNPTIKTYEEAEWAKLPDNAAPIETSLQLLDALHERWVLLLQSLTNEQYKRTFQHPALGPVPLEKNLALYAWHGKHHVEHIATLRERMGW
jgi:uncharacterized damage-inducible protein DinB